MKILAIDPSTTSCGYAVFKDDDLTDWGVISNTDKSSFIRSEHIANALHFVMVSEQPHLIVCEYPHKGGIGAKTMSIATLFHFCGMVHGMAKSSKLPIKFVEPIKWKGNIPKEIHQKRVIPKLEEKYDIKLEGESSDLIDAVALGDWFLRDR